MILDGLWSDNPNRSRFASNLPLVRVFVPREPKEPATEVQKQECYRRRLQHIVDVFVHGVMSPGHESDGTRGIEDQLGQEHALYFHGGRPHRDYGSCIIILKDIPNGVGFAVTPFGLANIACPGKTEPFHKRGACLSSIAHCGAIERQKSFLEANTWRGEWRDKVDVYFRHYFLGKPDRYFSYEPPPVSGNGHGGVVWDQETRDWRAWTVEIRIFQDLDLKSFSPEAFLLIALVENEEYWLFQYTQEHGKEATWYELISRRPEYPLRKYPDSEASVEAARVSREHVTG
jgi:hypothetical protein